MSAQPRRDDRPAPKVPLGLLVDLDRALGPISAEAARELDLAWRVLVNRPWQLRHGAEFSIAGRTWRFETFEGKAPHDT